MEDDRRTIKYVSGDYSNDYIYIFVYDVVYEFVQVVKIRQYRDARARGLTFDPNTRQLKLYVRTDIDGLDAQNIH
jgi:hypothetical protein